MLSTTPNFNTKHEKDAKRPVYVIRFLDLDVVFGSAGASYAVDGPPTGLPSAADLLLHYKLDEYAGTVADDAAAGENDGTLTNGPKWGDGVVLDGLNDKVDANAPLASFFQVAFSISCWINMDDGVENSWRGICGVKDTALDNLVYIYTLNGTIYAEYAADGNDSAQWSASSLLSNGQTGWHHLCVVYAPTGIVGYFDGVEVGSTAAMTGVTMADYTAGTINFHVGGGWYFSTTEYEFDGALKDFRIYTGELTQAHAQALCTAGRPDSSVAASEFDSTTKTSNITLSNSNKTAANSTASGTEGAKDIRGRNTGKYYFEFSIDTLPGTKQSQPGITKESSSPFTGMGAPSKNPAISLHDGRVRVDGASYITDTAGWAAGDICGIAIDLDNGEFYAAKNNSWISLSGESSDPATGTDPLYDALTPLVNYGPAASFYYIAGTMTLQCETGELTYTPPTGFTAWGD